MPVEPTDQEWRIIALGRYWAWSDWMCRHFFDELREHGALPQLDSPEAFKLMLHMSYWYGSLYVVVEGWRELRLADPEVDHLLQSSHVELLRRYRDGFLHYQRELWGDRFVAFLGEGGESCDGVREIHRALGRYLQKAVKQLATKVDPAFVPQFAQPEPPSPESDPGSS
jgi:hypothetical protein